MTLEEKYEYLKSVAINDSNVSRERVIQFQNLCNFMEGETSYLTAPASTKYHLSRDKGLLEHSCNVASNAIKIKRTLVGSNEISDFQCVLVGLFHDAGKAGLPGSPLYIKNEPTEKQKQWGYPATIPYRYNDNLVHVPHAIRSVQLLSKYIDLTPEEYQAIVAHDGQYVDDNKSYAHKETKLTMILHYADYWSCRFQED